MALNESDQGGDRIATVVVAALGILLVAWGWQRVANPAEVQPDPELKAKWDAQQKSGKSKDGPMGMSLE